MPTFYTGSTGGCCPQDRELSWYQLCGHWWLRWTPRVANVSFIGNVGVVVMTTFSAQPRWQHCKLSVGCQVHSLRCRQCYQSWHHDNSRFSGVWHCAKDETYCFYSTWCWPGVVASEITLIDVGKTDHCKITTEHNQMISITNNHFLCTTAPQILMTKFLWWIVENIFFLFKFCSGQVDQVLYDTLQYIPQNTHRFWLTLFRCIYIYSSCWNHEIDFHIFLKHDCFTGIGIILWNNHEEHGINRPMYSWHHSGYGLIQWEEALLTNASSHWLSPNP